MSKSRILLIIISIFVLLTTILTSFYLTVVYFPDKKEEEERNRLIKEYYENKLTLYKEENEKYADYEVDVAFLGDSLTDGYDLSAYYPEYITANRGIGGETTHGLESRLQVSVYDLKPKIAVMLIGGNNLNTMFENYENILIGLRDNLPETKIVLISLTAMGGTFKEKNKIAAYNNVIIKKLAAKYDFTFVDLYTPLLDETTGEIYSDYTSDGAHLTSHGYKVFTDTLTPTLDYLLQKNQSFEQ